MSQNYCAAVSTYVIYYFWPEGKKMIMQSLYIYVKDQNGTKIIIIFFCRKQVNIVIILNSRTNYKKISVKVRASILEIFSWLRQASTNSSLEIFPSVSVSISLNASLANSSGVV